MDGRPFRPTQVDPQRMSSYDINRKSPSDFSGLLRRIGLRAEWSAILTGCLLIVVFLALIRPLTDLAKIMMSREYYQHLPIVLLAAFALAIQRFRAQPVSPVFETSYRVAMQAAIAGFLTCCVYVLPSHWAAAPAAIFTLCAAVNFYGGREAATRMAGPVILAASCIPLPFQLDSRLVLDMQRLATWFASIWLDFFGVLHLTTGVAIQTLTRNYLVEDACSGISSTFAAITIGIGYGIFVNYRLPRLVLVVVQMIFWVVLTNAIRVFLVVYFGYAYDIDLTSSATHIALGVMTFAIGIMLAISSDHLLNYIFAVNTVNSAAVTEGNRYRMAFLDHPIHSRSVVLGGALFSLGVLAMTFAYSRYSTSGVLASTTTLELLNEKSLIDNRALDQSLLPSHIEGWSMIGFEVKEQTENTAFGGLRSLIWRYSNGGRQVAVSIDGPYADWHPLELCYQAIGWNLSSRAHFSVPHFNSGPVLDDLRLRRPPFDHAHVSFVCLGPKGQFVPPTPILDGIRDSLFTRLGWGIQDRPNLGGGVIQVQILDVTPMELEETQREENRQLLGAVVHHVLQHCKIIPPSGKLDVAWKKTPTEAHWVDFAKSESDASRVANDSVVAMRSGRGGSWSVRDGQ